MHNAGIAKFLGPACALLLIFSTVGITRSEARPGFAPQPAAALPQPYLEYAIYNDTIYTDPEMPPVLPGGQADYGAIFSRHNLCALVQSGAVDEVWIWAGNGDGITKGHMWEWTTSGPGWAGTIPDCGKVVTTLTYNYLREVDVALESYAHRLETFFGHYFPCDVSTATWPWQGSTTPPYSACGSQLSNRYGLVARPFDGNGFVGVCGDAHFPPNILSSTDAYNFSSPNSAASICQNWSEDGSAVPDTISCQTWGCTHYGYYLWWMQNIPGLNNMNKNRQGLVQPNWWPYLFGIPQPEYKTFLPMVKQSRGAAALIPTGPAQAMGSTFATAPRADPASSIMPDQGRSLSYLTSLPALKTKSVYVIYYPGYGGTPRAEIKSLTTELIAYLKMGTIYHGYNYPGMKATFLGQDGQSYAGRNCQMGDAPDNIHIRLEGLRSDADITGYQVEDLDGFGVWATPCNPISNWMVQVIPGDPGQADLYIKPFRDAPAGTRYRITVNYQDGLSDQVLISGAKVQLLVASFLGQDGGHYAGMGCSTGTVADNAHIKIFGLDPHKTVANIELHDYNGGGLWAMQCNPVSNWLLYVIFNSPNADLYIKPFRDAPDGTPYTVIIDYTDGSSQTITVTGSRIRP